MSRNGVPIRPDSWHRHPPAYRLSHSVDNSPSKLDVATRLRVLHDRIADCRCCESAVVDYVKPTSMDRGDAGRIVIVGQGPGSAEAAKQRAFAGPAGTRLDDWLVSAGADRNAPRRGIYLTSVTKCIGTGQASLNHMIGECVGHLRAQIEILEPRVVISLGAVAYDALSPVDTPFSRALCQLYNTADHLLLPSTGAHFALLVWPHPSPRNRWLNEDRNRKRLNQSFDLLRKYLHG